LLAGQREPDLGLGGFHLCSSQVLFQVEGGPCVLKPADQDVEAGGEPLVAVVDPDVLTQGDQGGEPIGGQGAEELVQLGSDGGVADALLVDRGGRAADSEADGVLDQQEEVWVPESRP
jgi:hypothetical protein